MKWERKSLMERFLKDPVPFSDKRDVNWVLVRNVAIGAVVLVVIGLLVIPGKSPEVEFSDRDRQIQEREILMNVPEGTYNQPRPVANYGYQSPTRGEGQRQGGMVISREGSDAAVSLQPGAKIRMRLLERVIVGSQSIPIVAIVTEDYSAESGVAIPKGSKVFGDASFDKDSSRALVSWKNIQFPGGRFRQFEALAAALNGHPGLEGTIHSEALKNALGHTMTRFVGAYAEGSMEKSPVFGSKGGHENGMKNAIAETAKDQADRYADSLKKERVWIELKPNTEFFALVTQSFRFRDPGGAYR
jgi:hypothetical protein